MRHHFSYNFFINKNQQNNFNIPLSVNIEWFGGFLIEMAIYWVYLDKLNSYIFSATLYLLVFQQINKNTRSGTKNRKKNTWCEKKQATECSLMDVHEPQYDASYL